MIILDVEQGTEEWMLARTGIPTASNFDKIITSTGKASTQAKSYMMKLVAEHFTSHKTEVEQTEWMLRGIEMEAEARKLYEFIYDREVSEVGMVYKNDLKLVSCSPDGLVGKGGLEIKCPAPHTHVQYLLDKRLPTKYAMQVHGSMWVTGLDTWDFMSYHPDMPHLLITVERDEKIDAMIEKEVTQFIDKMLDARSQVSSLMEAA